MKLTNENIVSVFFKRALFAMVFIGLISSTAIYFYQKNVFYTFLADEIKTSVDEKMKKYAKNLKLSSLSMIEKDADIFMKQLGFLTVEVYNDKKELLFHFVSKDKQKYEKLILMHSSGVYLNHDFPMGKKMNFDFFKVKDDNYFIQSFHPLYDSGELFGYIEGLAYVEPIIVKRFKDTIFATIATVILTIFIFAFLIFPLIYFSYKKLNKSTMELLMSNIASIHTLGNTIALRDSNTDEHNYRVTFYSIKLAQVLKIEKEDMKKLIIGAFLHDIGKIGISDSILLKNEKFNDDEIKNMQEHVIKGVDIIKGNKWFSFGKDIILYHHEKYDGSGYPNGVKGVDIPLIARIFSIIDVFDALTSKRPYKEAFSYDKAIEILNDGRGKHFDAKILDEFIKISKELYQTTQSKSKKLLQDELDSAIHKYFLD